MIYIKSALFKIELFLLTIFIGLRTSPVLAATEEACTNQSAGFLNIPTWYKYIPRVFQNGECQLLAEFPGDIPRVLLAVAEILLRAGGLVAVGFVIYGGFKFLLSQGDPENAKGARQTIINALIGIGIAASATALVNLIGGNLLKT